MAVRISVMVVSRSSIALFTFSSTGASSPESRCAFESHADCEDSLNDPIVELSGDSVPVVKDTEDSHPIVQASVLNGDACRERQRLGHGHVFIAEASAPRFSVR